MSLVIEYQPQMQGTSQYFSVEAGIDHPDSFPNLQCDLFFFPQRKAAIFRYRSKNEIQIGTRKGCVINSSSHKESGKSISLASLQGTWHQLVLPREGKWLCARVLEREVELSGALRLGFIGYFLSIWGYGSLPCSP